MEWLWSFPSGWQTSWGGNALEFWQLTCGSDLDGILPGITRLIGLISFCCALWNTVEADGKTSTNGPFLCRKCHKGTQGDNSNPEREYKHSIPPSFLSSPASKWDVISRKLAKSSFFLRFPLPVWQAGPNLTDEGMPTFLLSVVKSSRHNCLTSRASQPDNLEKLWKWRPGNGWALISGFLSGRAGLNGPQATPGNSKGFSQAMGQPETMTLYCWGCTDTAGARGQRFEPAFLNGHIYSCIASVSNLIC